MLFLKALPPDMPQHFGTRLGGPMGSEGAHCQKHNLFRARSAPIVGVYSYSYVCTPLVTSLILSNLLAERPMSGISFYVLRNTRNAPLKIGTFGGQSFSKEHISPPRRSPSTRPARPRRTPPDGTRDDARAPTTAGRRRARGAGTDAGTPSRWDAGRASVRRRRETRDPRPCAPPGRIRISLLLGWADNEWKAAFMCKNPSIQSKPPLSREGCQHRLREKMAETRKWLCIVFCIALTLSGPCVKAPIE